MFYVNQSELLKLSGRSRQKAYDARKIGKLPFEKLDDSVFLYDVDNDRVEQFIKNIPETWGANKLKPLMAYRKEFQRRRASQELVCAKTGIPDYMAALDPETDSTLLDTMDDVELDREKKRKEIQYKDMQIEKVKTALLALSGDLIDRQFVRTYNEKYLGTLHQQLLDFSGAGFFNEIYDLFKTEPDAMKAVKEAERMMEKEMSKLMKDSTNAMKENPL